MKNYCVHFLILFISTLICSTLYSQCDCTGNGYTLSITSDIPYAPVCIGTGNGSTVYCCILLDENGNGRLSNLCAGSYTVVGPSAASVTIPTTSSVSLNSSGPSGLWSCDECNNNKPINQTFKYELQQNFPNPFNPITKILYSIQSPNNVKITVYDISGKQVTTLVNEYKSSGSYSIDFDASNLSSGIYIYKLESGSFTDIKRMMVIK